MHDLLVLATGFVIGAVTGVVLETIGLIDWLATRLRNPKGGGNG